MRNPDIIKQRVDALRQWMRLHDLAAFILPSTDPHSGEYVADHWHSREWISGFDGSAGTAVVTLTSAALWTDSRYWLAATYQLEGTPFQLMRMGEPGTPQIDEWLGATLAAGQTVGLDAWVNTVACTEQMERALISRGLMLNTELDPTLELWEQRPPLPADMVEVQPVGLAGRTVADKLADIRASFARNGADALIVSMLDEVAWTLNLRGSDIHCSPLFVAYLFVEADRATLCIDERKLTDDARRHLTANGVEVRPYSHILPQHSMTIQYDPERTNAGIVRAMAQGQMSDAAVNIRFVHKPSPIMDMKSVKNAVEVEGFRRAMLRDGVAMVKFLRWLTTGHWAEGADGWTMNGERVTERVVDEHLTSLRAEWPEFRGLSFDTIAGYAHHAAIVHYEATPETDIPLEPRGLLLLDSGAQYTDGTTDITRTIALGPLTDDERRDYTLVLKGHLRLAMAVFPTGTTGTQLDVLARYAMWQEHKNYGHGTGHGVGSYLNVHEGPHQFRMNWMPAPLRAGMTVTVEPGIYVADSHGCRTENTMLIVEDGDSPYGHWLRMEPLTLCPIDTTPIIPEMLLPDEIQYLNSYHARVREALLPLLTDEHDREWLIQQTKEYGNR